PLYKSLYLPTIQIPISSHFPAPPLFNPAWCPGMELNHPTVLSSNIKGQWSYSPPRRNPDKK
ncbi:MAG: hypothetical protein WC145_08525, partial [Aliarcobacter sp.]